MIIALPSRLFHSGTGPGILTVEQQLANLHREFVELSKQNIETRQAIHTEVEAAFAAKYAAKFAELDDLRNELARRLTQARKLNDAELREAARG